MHLPPVPPDVPRMPLDERPRFARRMIAVWRKQHLAMGEDLTVAVWPGEWPPGTARLVVGAIPVREDERTGGPGGVMVLGRVGDVWRMAYQLAVAHLAGVNLDFLALVTVYGEVSDDPDMKIWMHPSPETGEVPMWTVPPAIQAIGLHTRFYLPGGNRHGYTF